MRFDTMKNFIPKDFIKDGAYVKILSPEPAVLDSNKYQNKDGSPKKRYIWTVLCNGNQHDLELNRVSRDEIIKVYGGESSDWVGYWLKCKTEFNMATRINCTYWLPVSDSENKELDKQFNITGEDKPISPNDIKWEE